MTQTEQERLDVFQQYLKKGLSREIRSKDYHPSAITIPGSASVLPIEGIPYYKEELEYNKIERAINALSSIDDAELDQTKQKLTDLINKYAPKVMLNGLCEEYYKKLLGAVIPIGNLHDLEQYNKGLADLTRLSKIRITPDNLRRLRTYVEIIKDHYRKNPYIKTIQEHNSCLEKNVIVEEMRQFGFFEETK